MVDRNQKQMSLLELFASELGCENLSDLRLLSRRKRLQLADILADIPADRAGLFEWNDALDYLVSKAPQVSPAAAREKLISTLRTGTDARFLD